MLFGLVLELLFEVCVILGMFMLKFELGGLMIFKIFFICLSFFGLVEFVEDFV